MRWLTYRGIPLWRDVRVLRAAAQIISAILVVTAVVFFVGNILNAADKRGLSMGFGFLGEDAGFPIGESVLEYHESDSFQYAFLVVSHVWNRRDRGGEVCPWRPGC